MERKSSSGAKKTMKHEFEEFIEGETLVSTKPNFLSDLFYDRLIWFYLKLGKYTEVFEMLGRSELNESANEVLDKLISSNNLTLYRLVKLVQYGVDLNKINDEETFLHYLLLKGKWKCFQYLIIAGADINTKDKNVNTVLILATKNRSLQYRKQFITFLLNQKDLIIDMNDSFGRSALYYAWLHNEFWLVQALMRKGASIHKILSKNDNIIKNEFNKNSNYKPADAQLVDKLNEILASDSRTALKNGIDYRKQYFTFLPTDEKKLCEKLIWYRKYIEIANKKLNLVGNRDLCEKKFNERNDENLYEMDIQEFEVRSEIRQQRKQNKNKLHKEKKQIEYVKGRENIEKDILQRVDRQFPVQLKGIFS